MPLRFAECTVDFAGRALSRSGTPVHLTPKAFDLLQLLLERRPSVLSKDALLETLWHGTFVTEANIPNLIGEIREAIGDEQRPPTLIRTVHGRGYAFIGAVSDSSARTETTGTVRLRLTWGRQEAALGDGEYVLGRGEECDVRVYSTNVSRRHATLSVQPAGATVKDLGSKNGTFVNSRRVRATGQELRDGDTLRLGTVSLNVALFDASAATETVGRRGRRPSR